MGAEDMGGEDMEEGMRGSMGRSMVSRVLSETERRKALAERRLTDCGIGKESEGSEASSVKSARESLEEAQEAANDSDAGSSEQEELEEAQEEYEEEVEESED
jgi:hypothetical protein